MKEYLIKGYTIYNKKRKERTVPVDCRIVLYVLFKVISLTH